MDRLHFWWSNLWPQLAHYNWQGSLSGGLLSSYYPACSWLRGDFFIFITLRYLISLSIRISITKVGNVRFIHLRIGHATPLRSHEIRDEILCKFIKVREIFLKNQFLLLRSSIMMEKNWFPWALLENSKRPNVSEEQQEMVSKNRWQ